MSNPENRPQPSIGETQPQSIEELIKGKITDALLEKTSFHKHTRGDEVLSDITMRTLQTGYDMVVVQYDELAKKHQVIIDDPLTRDQNGNARGKWEVTFEEDNEQAVVAELYTGEERTEITEQMRKDSILRMALNELTGALEANSQT